MLHSDGSPIFAEISVCLQSVYFFSVGMIVGCCERFELPENCDV